MLLSVKKGLLAVGVLVVTSSVASADAVDFASGFTIDTSPIFVVAAVIMVAIGSIWAIKKVIALGNKS